MDCIQHREQLLDNCRALFYDHDDVRLLTYTRPPLGGGDRIASKVNYHAMIVPKDPAEKFWRERVLLGPSHALSREGAITTLLKQSEEMLGDMLLEGEESEEELGGRRDHGKQGVYTEPFPSSNVRLEDPDLGGDPPKPQPAADELTVFFEALKKKVNKGAGIKNRPPGKPLLPAAPDSFLDNSASLLGDTDMKNDPLQLESLPTSKVPFSPVHPRDSTIGIALGVRDSWSLPTRREKSSGAQGWSEWCLPRETQAAAVPVPGKPSLPQALLAEQGLTVAPVQAPSEFEKSQAPATDAWHNLWFPSLSSPRPLPRVEHPGQADITCPTPITHRESFITATGEIVHKSEPSSGTGAFSPSSPGMGSTGRTGFQRSSHQCSSSEAVQFEFGIEEGYESEVSQTTFATRAGVMTPGSDTSADIGGSDPKQKSAQELSRLNRELVRNEVELAIKTLLCGLVEQVGNPKVSPWDSP